MAEEGVSILETESYVLAIVFLVFLAVFTVAEKVRTVSCRFVSAYCAQSDQRHARSCWSGDKLT